MMLLTNAISALLKKNDTHTTWKIKKKKNHFFRTENNADVHISHSKDQVAYCTATHFCMEEVKESASTADRLTFQRWKNCTAKIQPKMLFYPLKNSSLPKWEKRFLKTTAKNSLDCALHGKARKALCVQLSATGNKAVLYRAAFWAATTPPQVKWRKKEQHQLWYPYLCNSQGKQSVVC